MILNVDSGYRSRRGTQGRYGGGIASLRGAPGVMRGRGYGIGVFVNAQGQVIPDNPALDAQCAASGGTMDAFGNCVTSDNLIAADSQNPYLSSPAYEATQGGVTPQQSAAATEQDYCATSANNAAIFGTPIDPECTGAAPFNTGVILGSGTFNALASSAPSPTVVTPVRTVNTLTPPAAPAIRAVASMNAGGSNSLNPNVLVNGNAPAGNNSTNSNTNSNGTAASGACQGIGVGECLGPLDLGTWGLIAAAIVVALVAAK